MFEVKKLSKKYGEKYIFNNISLNIKKGECSVIIGNSGEGKSTFLNCINGLSTFDEGFLFLDGKELYKKNKKENKSFKEIGLIFQNFNLFSNLNVIENITLSPIVNYGVDKKKAEEEADNLLKMLDIYDKKYECINKLSGGQKQRVAIARAIILKPKLICMDEPTSALDKENTLRIIDIIEKLKNEGISVLIVTHDMFFVDNIKAKVYELKDTKLIEK